MRTRLSVLTLCVDDLERSHRLYRDGLGLQSPGGSHGTSFFSSQIWC